MPAQAKPSTAVRRDPLGSIPELEHLTQGWLDLLCLRAICREDQCPDPCPQLRSFARSLLADVAVYLEEVSA